MTQNSNTALPAHCVVMACSDTLFNIACSRAALLRDIAESLRDRGRFWPKRSVRGARKLLTEDDKEIAALHRADEETDVKNLMALAKAAMHVSPKFTVTVSVADFSHIGLHYKPEAP